MTKDNNHTQPKGNIMATMPIPKLLVTISLPIAISMLIQALYNIIDSIFVAKLGEDALTAVSLTYPVQMLIVAVAVGTSVGMNALVSRYLGARKPELASLVARNALFLSILNGIVFAIIGISFSKIFFTFQTTNEQVINYGSHYMFLVSTFSIFIFFQITFERDLQATGKSIYSMMSQALGAIVNIILDPILIFGLFGFPRLEVTGAAIATIIGQCSGACLGFYLVRRHATDINISMKGFRPSATIIKDIYKIGFPAILMQSLTSIMSFGLNNILLMFTTTATAVFGVYVKLQSFIFMPVYGLTNGLIPIIGFNYGAKQKGRIIASFKLATIIASIIMIFGTFIFNIIPMPLLQLFDASEELLSIGIPALRIISFSFPFAGFCLISCSLYQALGKSVYSLMISSLRQLVILLPMAYLLAIFGGLNYVWYSIIIAEICSFIICVLLTKRTLKTCLNSLL